MLLFSLDQGLGFRGQAQLRAEQVMLLFSAVQAPGCALHPSVYMECRADSRRSGASTDDAFVLNGSGFRI